jgi:hypothetical protein
LEEGGKNQTEVRTNDSKDSRKGQGTQQGQEEIWYNQKRASYNFESNDEGHKSQHESGGRERTKDPTRCVRAVRSASFGKSMSRIVKSRVEFDRYDWGDR